MEKPVNCVTSPHQKSNASPASLPKSPESWKSQHARSARTREKAHGSSTAPGASRRAAADPSRATTADLTDAALDTTLHDGTMRIFSGDGIAAYAAAVAGSMTGAASLRHPEHPDMKASNAAAPQTASRQMQRAEASSVFVLSMHPIIPNRPCFANGLLRSCHHATTVPNTAGCVSSRDADSCSSDGRPPCPGT